MKIYNTLTRTKEELVPIDKNEIKIYACGPTVYNFIHIGNARPLCVFDVLRRYLEWRGYTVRFVQNFTDIDDKLIKKANEEGTSVPEVAERYIKEFWTDAKGAWRPSGDGASEGYRKHRRDNLAHRHACRKGICLSVGRRRLFPCRKV